MLLQCERVLLEFCVAQHDVHASTALLLDYYKRKSQC